MARSTPRDGRLLLLAAAVVILMGFLAGRAAFERIGSLLVNHGLGPGLASIVPAPVYAGIVVAALWGTTRLIPSLGVIWSSLSVSHQTLCHLSVGMMAAGLFVAAVYSIDLACGWVSLARAMPSTRLFSTLSGYFLLYVVIAFNEELVFRGVLLEILSRLRSPLWGVIGSSALFAIVHLESSSTLQRLLGLFLFGALLAQLYLVARSLWLPIAMHWGVHSLSFAAALGLPPIRIVFSGPISLIGRPDQLDAGWISIAVLAAAGAMTWQLLNRMRSDAKVDIQMVRG